MSEPTPIYDPKNGPAQVAGFMSGSGSNITKLLELEQKLAETPEGSPFHVSCIVTDCLDTAKCNARKIAKEFGDLPVVESDIKAFYRERGLTKVSVATPEGFQAREEWTEALWETLKPFSPDLGAFGGFIPLTNICAKMPCINVHPGDLSVMKDGKPYLVGLHTIPIKLAILGNYGEVRTTTILATPYTEKLEMDEGPVLLISEPLLVDLPEGMTLETLAEEENKEVLKEMAADHQNRLKEVGDWEVFPLTLQLVAQGKFALDKDENVYFDGKPIKRGLKLPL